MKIDKNLENLPLTKSKPGTLQALFGTTEIEPAWVADQDFEIAKPIQEALIKRISDSGFGYEYKPESFLKAQQNWYQQRYQVTLNPAQVLYSPSITSTIAIALENLTSPGDGVIIQPPVFMEFKDAIRATNRTLVKNPLILRNGRYEIDFENLKQSAALETNKVLILCNPHNPVGRVWKREELEILIEICRKNELLLISDEIHKDIVLFDNTFHSALNFATELDHLIVCTSEAKTFNLCGISDSMAIIPNETLRNTIKKTFSKYNLGRTNALTSVALQTAYLHGHQFLNELISAIETNIQIVEEEIYNSNSQIRLIKPEGTYQIWLDFNALFSDSKQMFKHVIDKSGVGLNAGHWFGREGAMFMRMNIATSEEKVRSSILKVIESCL